MRLRILLALILSFQSTGAFAVVAQYAFPARCSIYAACDGETCVSVWFPASSVLLIKENEEFYLAGSEDRRVNLGYFETLELAQEFVASDTTRNFGAVLIPNDEIADAFGMDVRSLYFSRGTTFVSDKVTKISCSAINGGLY